MFKTFHKVDEMRNEQGYVAGAKGDSNLNFNSQHLKKLLDNQKF